MQPKKILIVEADEHLRLLYKLELEDEGNHTLVASRARDAIQAMENKRLDLIVLAIKWPYLQEVGHTLELIEKARGLPILVISDFPLYKESALSWGVQEYVVKSSNLNELKDKIRICLGQESQHQPSMGVQCE